MHNQLTGTISLNAKGKGFVAIEGREDDIQIEPEHVSIALPGDTVRIETYTGFKGLIFGKVIEIVERKKTQFVGTLLTNTHDQAGPNGVLAKFALSPDDKRANIEIDITGIQPGTQMPNSNIIKDATEAQEALNNLKENLKVVAVITDWQPSYGRIANGEITRIIGEKGLNDVEMQSIVFEKGFDTTFDPEVIEDAEDAAKTFSSLTPSAEELASRRDMRGVFTCTIDPFDAKDFDDALSIRPLDASEADGHEGAYELGIHIADVAHYVRPGTALDREARKRAFSVYLVDRTIPMLPSVLSNGMCSLNPNEDRFAFSTIFKMDKNGKIFDKWFGRTIIHSDRRFTYEEVQEILNKISGKDSAGADIPSSEKISVDPSDKSSWHKSPYAVELSELNRIAKIMLKERQEAGSIDFESTEIKFKLDDQGRPIAVYKKERLDAHRLVEEYMLLANREVAEYIHEKNKELKTEKYGVYRTHDLPDYERLQDLGIFVRALGFDFNPSKKISPKDIQKLLKQVEGSPAEAVIKIATLRSMAKATYSTGNTGHFGLAFNFYTQFTSPIRRYPDLMVHRILAILLEGKTVPHHMAITLEKICMDSSRREVEAADAERASIKYKQVEFMANKVGQTIDAVVSGIADWGMYIEEPEAKAEGLIRLKDLKPDDFYSVDQKNYKIVGQNTKKEFNIGDAVRVKLVSADLDNRMLEFQLVD